MRHVSERVPGKNYRSFAGLPLYHHVLRSLLDVDGIDRVMIDTDSPWIMEDAKRNFPEVLVVERPPHLRAGTVPMNEILLHDTAHAESAFFLQTHSTNPLLKSETIETALARFLDAYPAHDSLFSVTRVQARLWDALGRPINHNPAILLRTQDLPPVYEENSCLYIFTRETLERRRNRIGERPLIFELDRLEAVDIDEELDFVVAEFLYQRHARNA